MRRTPSRLLLRICKILRIKTHGNTGLDDMPDIRDALAAVLDGSPKREIAVATLLRTANELASPPRRRTPRKGA